MDDQNGGFQAVRSKKSKTVRGAAARPYLDEDAASTANRDEVLVPVAASKLLPDVHMNDEEEAKEAETSQSLDKEAASFPQLTAAEELIGGGVGVRGESRHKQGGGLGRHPARRIPVPPYRYSPLKKHWLELAEPIVKHMKLQIRMNTRRRCVELRISPKTPEISYLQKGADFIRSFLLGFDVQDAIALLRLDDLFMESFEIKDVKRLAGDHLSRCIGRISGKEGKTKYAIENATRTRIVLADSHIHILGAFQNIKLARDSVCSLILGSPPGKVYNHLRTVARRLQERL